MYIVITLPQFFDGESDAITGLFQAGLQRLHLRKPQSAIDDVRALLQAIPSVYHPRIVLHEHFQLLQEFQLCGVHLNSRNPHAPQEWQGHVSVSCHSIEELAKRKAEGFNYLSLSPIFDSISKQGYASAFSAEELQRAAQQGIIDHRVMALGGICNDNIAQALSYGFGGVMVLGDAWQTQLPVVLSVAGSDSSAGAGIQQDLKTLTHCGVYGATCITAVTSQNTLGVQQVFPVPGATVASQLQSVFSDLQVRVVKIGMLPNLEVAQVVVHQLREELARRVLPVVCDPIMFSTSGTRLMSQECIEYVARQLFPLCTLITPNIPEYQYLVQQGLLSADAQQFPCSMLLKGGHAQGDNMTDVLYLRDEQRQVSFTSQRITTANLHGTGCTLSSAIAAGLAQHQSLETAVRHAKNYMQQAIAGGKHLHIGHGNGPLWME